MEARDEVDLKLIELVKPHSELYNPKDVCNTSAVKVYSRNKLWNEICAKMNKTFRMSRSKSFIIHYHHIVKHTQKKLKICRSNAGTEEYRKRWRSLRDFHNDTLKRHTHRRPNIMKKMRFMKSYHRNRNAKDYGKSVSKHTTQNDGPRTRSVANQQNSMTHVIIAIKFSPSERVSSYLMKLYSHLEFKRKGSRRELWGCR